MPDKQQLLLGRDRVGKKPLFFARQGSRFWFASELMALLQDPEICAHSGPAGDRELSRVSVRAGSIQRIRRNREAPTGVDADHHRGRRSDADIGHLTTPDSTQPGSREELEERLRELIWEATRIRLMSEVPLGAFLSGGIDSSAVVAAMADQTPEPVKTFSIGFPDADFDELGFARQVAQHFSTDHHEFIVEPHAIEIMPKLARHYGEPFADAVGDSQLLPC